MKVLENTDHVIDDNCRLNQPELVHFINNTTFVSNDVLPDQYIMLNGLPGTVAYVLEWKDKKYLEKSQQVHLI